MRPIDDEDIREGLAELRMLSPSLPGQFFSKQPYEPPWDQRSFLVPLARFRKALNIQSLEREALLKDIRFLHRLLAQCYPGYELGLSAGMNWDGSFENWRDQVSRGPASIPLNLGFKGFQDILKRWPDVHTGPLTDQLLSSLKAVTRLEQPLDGPHRVAPLFDPREAHLQQTPFYVESGVADRLSSPSDSTTLPTYQELGGSLLYLGFPRFERNSPAWLTANLSKGLGLPRIKGLILDFRGNLGGDLILALNSLKPLFPGLNLWTAFRGLIEISDAEPCHISLRLGQTLSQVAKLSPPYPLDLRGGFENQVLRWKQPHVKPTRPSTSQAHVDGAEFPILVLADGATSSDAELLVYGFQKVLGAVVAGEVTAGAIRLIQPGALVLPHTGVLFRLATAVSYSIPCWGTGVGTGIVPDILAPELKTPQQVEHLFRLATGDNP